MSDQKDMGATPGDAGLVMVGEIEEYEGYDWSAFGVWRDHAGRLFYAEDSGCSCNFAWDSITVADLTPGTAAQIAKEARAFANEWSTVSSRDAEDLIRAVETAVRP